LGDTVTLFATMNEVKENKLRPEKQEANVVGSVSKFDGGLYRRIVACI